MPYAEGTIPGTSWNNVEGTQMTILRCATMDVNKSVPLGYHTHTAIVDEQQYNGNAKMNVEGAAGPLPGEASSGRVLVSL